MGDTVFIDASGQLTDKKFHPQWGARIQQSFWGADLGVHVVQHLDRSLPLVFFDPENPTTVPPTIVYQHVTEVGGTLQKVWGPVIVKGEFGYRRFTKPNQSAVAMGPVPGRNHTLAALGLEWGLAVGEGETTFLLEAQNAFGLDDDASGILLFQRDILVGARHDFADEASQTLSGSVILDLERPSRIFANVEYGRRLGENWTTQIGYRLIRYPPVDKSQPVGPEFLNNANYAYVNLSRFF